MAKFSLPKPWDLIARKEVEENQEDELSHVGNLFFLKGFCFHQRFVDLQTKLVISIKESLHLFQDLRQC